MHARDNGGFGDRTWSLNLLNGENVSGGRRARFISPTKTCIHACGIKPDYDPFRFRMNVIYL